MGSVDNLWVMVSFFAVAIMIITTAVFWNIITTEVSDLWSHTTTGQEVLEDSNTAVSLFDFILFLGYLGLHLGILVTSFFLKSHPIGLLIVVFMLLIIVIVAVPISNVYGDLIDEPAFASVKADFPITHHILLYLPMVELVWSILNGIILYGFSASEMV